MSGLHPTPRNGYVPPQPSHIEVIAWFNAVIPPNNERTVIVRLAGQPGSHSAWYQPKYSRWLSAVDGVDITADVQAWAERPTGIEPKHQARAPGAADVIAKLTMTNVGGFSLRLSQIGRSLPVGEHELQLVAKPAITGRAK